MRIRSLAPVLSVALAMLASCRSDAPTEVVLFCEDGSRVVGTRPCDPLPPTVVDHVALLNAARTRWAATRPASYEYTLAITCFCGSDFRRPVRIVVDGTTVTSRSYADDGAPINSQFLESFPSIDGLFDLLINARSNNAARANATYDGTRGYPLQISLDYRTNIADDESDYQVTGFRVR